MFPGFMRNESLRPTRSQKLQWVAPRGPVEKRWKIWSGQNLAKGSVIEGVQRSGVGLDMMDNGQTKLGQAYGGMNKGPGEGRSGVVQGRP